MKVPRQLTTDRLLLRPHRMEDLDAFSSFLTDPEATRFMPFTPDQKTRDGARQMLEYVIASYSSAEPVFSLSIVDPAEDAYLGSCGLHPLDDDDGLEIYFAVLPGHQHRGLATEAARGLIDYVWRVTNTDHIIAFVVAENVPSVRVVEKLGFVNNGLVERQVSTGQVTHATMSDRRYVLNRCD